MLVAESPQPAMQAAAVGQWKHVGAVVIGRNEGRRLQVCLQAVLRDVRQVVYVDSGSTDNSVAVAAALGAEVVRLDPRFPFNAGRARAEGFTQLLALFPTIRYVQFVDGDSELLPNWIGTAADFLDGHPQVAAVTGRLRERHPERSIYNTLCAVEWDAYRDGETLFCGGNSMMRVGALREVGGFRSDLVAGEEPELCHRLHAAKWRIWLLPEGIAVHDAAMTRFGQWWTRAVRSGYACAQVAPLYGGFIALIRGIASAWFWTLGVPVIVLMLWPWLGTWALLALLIYPAQVLRQAILGAGRGRGVWAWAVFSLLIKYPNFLGQMQRFLHQILRREARLIDYKSPRGET